MRLGTRIVLAVLLLGLAGSAPAARTAAAGPQEASPAAPPSPPGKDPLEEFVPREKLPADSAVAFPVDI